MIAVDNPDLKAGVSSLSRLLSLPEHPDHFVLLQVGFRQVHSVFPNLFSSLSDRLLSHPWRKLQITTGLMDQWVQMPTLYCTL